MCYRFSALSLYLTIFRCNFLDLFAVRIILNWTDQLRLQIGRLVITLSNDLFWNWYCRQFKECRIIIFKLFVQFTYIIKVNAKSIDARSVCDILFSPSINIYTCIKKILLQTVVFSHNLLYDGLSRNAYRTSMLS